MLLGVTSQNRTFFPQKLVCQTHLKYEKELFDQIKKLKASFFGVSNTHYIIMVRVKRRRTEDKKKDKRIKKNI